MDQLSDKVQSLPPELFDKIFELTFLANTSEVTIDSSYKPPNCLQVSRATRRGFARSYYSSTTFYYDLDIAVNKWLQSLDKFSSTMIQDLRNESTVIDAKSCTLGELQDRLGKRIHRRSGAQTPVQLDAHKSKIDFGDPSGEIWVHPIHLLISAEMQDYQMQASAWYRMKYQSCFATLGGRKTGRIGRMER